jgi:tungstate transport system substrate-binding protein
VIGGMVDTDFWPQLSERFTDYTGIPVEVVVSGPKHEIADAFMQGEADLITMHASDTIINLVADGYGEDPQPWARNDLLLVGPTDDPAGIQGEADAVVALGKLIRAQSSILVHSSLGTNEVLRDLLSEVDLELDPQHTLVLPSDRHRQMLLRAAQQQAYTLVGRIPFLNGKIAHDDLAIMVQGDRRLRRPYVVVVATAERVGRRRHTAARRLAQFLRQRDTQDWIANFGRGSLDDRPLFFPVAIPDSELTFIDENGQASRISTDIWRSLTRQQVQVNDRNGQRITYDGVLLAELLKQQGVPFGESLKGPPVQLVVQVLAADSYRATFSLVELDPATPGRIVLVADRRDGKPLTDGEGPFRLIVPDEERQVRWVRMVESIRLTRPQELPVVAAQR